MKAKCTFPEGHGHVMDRSSGLHCLKMQIRKRGNDLVLWACTPCERHPGWFEKMRQGSNILLSSRVLLDAVPSTSLTSLNCTWKHSHFADVCRAYSRQQIRKLSHTEIPKLITSQAKIDPTTYYVSSWGKYLNLLSFSVFMRKCVKSYGEWHLRRYM